MWKTKPRPTLNFSSRIFFSINLIFDFLVQNAKEIISKESVTESKLNEGWEKSNRTFFSAKDLALVESLAKDGFEIPKELDYQEIAKKYSIPSNLLQLAKSRESAFLTLKLVEIIGEDEAYNLDSETIYFITHLLNQNNLKKIRNEILISALPQRS